MTTSKEYFNENLQTTSPTPNTDPEKWNLYNGLCALSQEIESLRSEVLELKNTNVELLKRLSSR